MKKVKILFLLFTMFLTLFFLRGIMASDSKELIHLVLKDGTVVIETRPDLAPKHVDQIKQLISEGQYNGVVFHRVIKGFMAQTGDVQFGNSKKDSFDLNQAGTGSSNLSDLKAEFSNIPHERGTLSMARSSDPNSANSQFFICFESSPHLDRNYTVFGKVTKGMEFVDKIKKGTGPNGSVEDPDKIIRISLTK